MQLAGRILKQWEGWLAVVCLCVVFPAGMMTTGSAFGASQSIGRSRVYRFQYITSEQGKAFLSQLKINADINAFTKDALIVTSSSDVDLDRASATLTVLDQERPTAIRTLLVKTDDQGLPHPEAFVAGLQTITAGTFEDAPDRNAIRPAIVDVLDDKLIAIGTEDVLGDLEKAMDQWKKDHQKTRKAAAQEAILTQPAKPLAEVAAELFEMESVTQVKEPNSAELVKEVLASEAETEADFQTIEMLRALVQAEAVKSEPAAGAAEAR